MPESLTPELIKLREDGERFATDVLLKHDAMIAAGNLDPETARRNVINAAKEAGFFAMTQPSRFGGSEAGVLALTVLRDTLAGFNPGFLHATFGPGPGVLANCADPLRSTYLAPMMEGTKRGAFGFTEPDDATQFTTAVPDGDSLVINGQKSYVTGGLSADFINTLVEVQGEGRAMVVIDRGDPGATIDRTFESLDGSHHAALKFVNVTVPRTRLIGNPGEGMPRAMRQIGDTRLAMAAEAIGRARWVINFIDTHLKAPDRSGEPRGNKEGVRLRYADLRIKTFAARSMLYRAARLAEQGANVVNEGIATKVFATETLGEVVDTGIQLVGGNALTVDHPLAILYRQARSLRLAEGASDVLRLNLARGALDLGKGVL